jgi:hypothetical protein
VIEAPRTSLRRRDHLEHIIHARGFEEIDLHRAHHEGKARRLPLASNSAR